MDLLLAVLERVYTYSERYSWSVMSVTGTAGENKGRETQKACLLKLSGNEAWRDECRLKYLPSGLLEVIMGKHSPRYQAPLPAFFQICASMRDDSTLISLSLCVCRVVLWYASLASSHDALGARHKMQPH